MLAFTCFVVVLYMGSGKAQYLHGPDRSSGEWGFWDYCHQDHFVSSAKVKVVKPLLFDHEGLSAISFDCTNKLHTNDSLHQLWSYEGRHGEWKKKYSCNAGDFIVGYRIRYQQPQGFFHDDSATTNVELECGSGKRIMGEGTSVGDWTEWKRCKSGFALCGLQTKVDRVRSMDEAGLITFNSKCCELYKEKPITELLIDEESIVHNYPVEVISSASTNVWFYLLGVILVLCLVGSLACVLGNFSMFRKPRQALEEIPVTSVAVMASVRDKFQAAKLPHLTFTYNKKADGFSEPV